MPQILFKLQNITTDVISETVFYRVPLGLAQLSHPLLNLNGIPAMGYMYLLQLLEAKWPIFHQTF